MMLVFETPYGETYCDHTFLEIYLEKGYRLRRILYRSESKGVVIRCDEPREILAVSLEEARVLEQVRTYGSYTNPPLASNSATIKYGETK
jgi:hypothetical protein